jgi:PAS domain S-box-containing protein
MSVPKRSSARTTPTAAQTPTVDGARLRQLADALPALVSIVDRRLVYQYVNRSYSEWFGRRADDIVGRPMVDVLGESALSIIRPKLEAALAGETVTYEATLPYRHGGTRFVRGTYAPDRGDDGVVRGVFVMVHDLSDRRATEAALATARNELAQRVAGLTRLHELATRLAGLHDPDEAFRAILQSIVELKGTDRGVLSLWDAAAQSLHVVASVGFSPDQLARLRAIREGGGACRRAATGGRRIVITDVEEDEGFAPHRALARELGFRAVHSTPLLSRSGACLGVLAVHFPAPRPDIEVERQLAEMHARQAADFLDRVRAEASLRASEAALREADRRKDDFLATLAHELRNPLAPIRSSVEVLRHQPAADEAAVRAKAVIDRQVRQMARLLDDLLDVSRITRNKLHLRRQRVTLAEVVGAAVETSRPLVDDGRHSLQVALPPGPVVLDADPVRLAQVFSNLLNNAAKYTDPGGHITLEATVAGGEVCVSVRDTGIGIAAELQPRLFDMFTQAEPALERSQGGLGIGLSLVRGLTELHGGSVEAMSGGPGAGSTFKVTLPLASPSRERAPEVPVRAGAAMPARRVLVADDLRDGADTLALLLRLDGHDAHAVYGGDEAVEAAATLRPDIVLLDIGMPRVNGYEAARRIREAPWGASMTLIAATGWGQQHDKARAREAGFDHHLTKPIEPDHLRALIGRIPAPGGTATGP